MIGIKLLKLYIMKLKKSNLINYNLKDSILEKHSNMLSFL